MRAAAHIALVPRMEHKQEMVECIYGITSWELNDFFVLFNEMNLWCHPSIVVRTWKGIDSP